MSVQLSQIMLFLYLVVGALGVIVGGMIGDRFGRHRVIWISILGSLPFALLLPYADLFWTGVLSVLVSLVMASAFSSILIYAIDLVPHRVGLVGGLFYGLAFGLGGLAAAGLGVLADHIGIVAVFKLVAWLPALGPADLPAAAHHCGAVSAPAYSRACIRARAGRRFRYNAPAWSKPHVRASRNRSDASSSAAASSAARWPITSPSSAGATSSCSNASG